MGLTGNGFTEGFLELGEAFPSLTLSIAIAVSVIPTGAFRRKGRSWLALGNAVRWNCCRILRLQLSFHAWVPRSFILKKFVGFTFVL